MAHDNEGAVRLMHRVLGDVEQVDMDGDTAEFMVSLDAAPSRRPPRPEGRLT